MRKLLKLAAALAFGIAVAFAGLLTPATPAAAQCSMLCPAGSPFDAAVAQFFMTAARGAGVANTEAKKEPRPHKHKKRK